MQGREYSPELDQMKFHRSIDSVEEDEKDIDIASPLRRSSDRLGQFSGNSPEEEEQGVAKGEEAFDSDSDHGNSDDDDERRSHFNDKKHEKKENDYEYDSKMDEESIENLSTGDFDDDDHNDYLPALDAKVISAPATMNEANTLTPQGESEDSFELTASVQEESRNETYLNSSRRSNQEEDEEEERLLRMNEKKLFNDKNAISTTRKSPIKNEFVDEEEYGDDFDDIDAEEEEIDEESVLGSLEEDISYGGRESEEVGVHVGTSIN